MIILKLFDYTMLYTCQLCSQQTLQPYICEPCYSDLAVSPEATEFLVRQAHPELDGVFSPYLYQPPVSKLIQELKYQKRYSHSRLLAYLFYKKLCEIDSESVFPGHDFSKNTTAEHIVPVPLHPKKLKAKGFNQSFELARFICSMLGCKHLLHHSLCQRVINTPSQTGLNKKARSKNMEAAFMVNGSLNAKHLILVDDVLTTGSTAASLAKTLKAAGAERVDLWTIAFAELR